MTLVVETDICMWVLSIFGHILLDFMEIFQVGGYPNVEYQFLQVNWGASALFLKVTVTNDTYSGKGHINLGFVAYSDTTYWIHVNLGTYHILSLTNKC